MPNTVATEQVQKVDKVNKTVLSARKTKAVELWRETRGHISNICRAIGVSRTAFYKWLNEDEAFAMAIADAEAELNDDVRDSLIQKIADGDTTAIRYYLDRRHPDFKPQPTTLIQNNTVIADKRKEYELE